MSRIGDQSGCADPLSFELQEGPAIFPAPQNIESARSAKLLIDQHGDDAPIFAAMQADKRAEAGDMEGRRVSRHALLRLSVSNRIAAE